MNHTRNAVRFFIVIFWIIVIGLGYTVISHSGNAYALSWASWLFYAVVTIVVLYIGAVLSFKLWNIK
ncbi:hypothetical protein PA10_00237 [Pseudomonas phage pPa_SNUABM_DT01]|nr:hypothetical protein PA10_00237 [Pseudomonas phage pPa_SNUABM_DT01]